MARFIGAVLVAAVLSALGGPARSGGDQDVNAILDKAIKALGGEERLGKLKAYTVKAKGTARFGGSADSAFTSRATVQGLDHLRSEFQGELGGNQVKGVTVLAGDKGWRKFGDMNVDMDKETVANEKRNVYLQVVPGTLLPLKGKGFKVQAAGEEKVAGKPAAVLKVTGPDGKDFKLFFDKKSGLPVKLVAKFVGFMGEEFTIETTYADYKDFGGYRKATRIATRRGGEPYLDQQVTEFRVLFQVDPKTFARPQ
jgi:hypothetical protein